MNVCCYNFVLRLKYILMTYKQMDKLKLSTCTCLIRIPYKTKLFIGINVREIRYCQNREKFKHTKTYFQQVPENNTEE